MDRVARVAPFRPDPISDLARASFERAGGEGTNQRFKLSALCRLLNESFFDSRLPCLGESVDRMEPPVSTYELWDRPGYTGQCPGRMNLDESLGNIPRDLAIDIILHEMIHEYLVNFEVDAFLREDFHGPRFVELMNEINTHHGRNITVE